MEGGEAPRKGSRMTHPAACVLALVLGLLVRLAGPVALALLVLVLL